MEIKPECYPCILLFTLRTARQVTEDEWLLKKVMNETMEVLRDIGTVQTPPEVATDVFGRIVRTLGQKDPLKSERERMNTEAKKLLPEAEKLVTTANDPLFAAMKFAALGNGFDTLFVEKHLLQTKTILEQFNSKKFHTNDYEEFKKDISGARRLLYILDNAGEIFFDKLLIRYLKKQYKKMEVTAVVRKDIVFDDATYEDAKAAKIEEDAKVIDCGFSTLGTPLHSCSKEFQQVFNETNIVLAKGQANYETLESEVTPGSPFAGKPIYFLLTVKCDVVSEVLGLPLGTPVLVKEL